MELDWIGKGCAPKSVKVFRKNRQMEVEFRNCQTQVCRRKFVKLTWNNLEIVEPKFVEENSSN